MTEVLTVGKINKYREACQQFLRTKNRKPNALFFLYKLTAMRLFLKYIMVLIYAITGFFSFYLVIINFLENVDSVSKPVLFLRLGAAVVLTAAGAIVYGKMRTGAIIALVCLACLATLWMDFSNLSGDIDPSESQESMLERMFPMTYITSLTVSVLGLVFPVKEVRKAG
jgi:hypothetical protein